MSRLSAVARILQTIVKGNISMATAVELKEQGNAKFKAQQYQEAIDLYRQAIDLDSTNAALFSNRSVCHLLLGQPGAALSDAVRACQLRPDWEKVFYRQGAALEALDRQAEALAAYQRAMELNPMSDEVVSKVRELKKRVNTSKHKPTARPGVNVREPMSMPEGGFSTPGPSSWAQGLTPTQQAEWLVDCYRMRVDDDMVYNVGFLHGLYDLAATNDTIAEDFLIFCKLAVQHDVIPTHWDWARFLQTAERLLPYAFEKSDAKDKWGGENVFRSFLGGRSLRFTGEVVYGKSCMFDGGMDHGDSGKDFEDMWEKVTGKWKQVVQGLGMFSDVGGVQAWQRLHQKVFVASC